MRRSFIALSLFLLVATAFADDAAWMQVGDAGNFTKNKQIRMVEEEVTINLSNKGMRVHAWFKFRNEGPATKVTMAFPDGIRDYKTRSAKAPRAIRWFKSSVDGQPLKVARQLYRPENGFDYEAYTHVWTKKVDFKKNQTRMVVVDYEANHGDIGDFIDDVYTLQTGATWKGPIGKVVLIIDWSGLRGQTDPTIRRAKKPLWTEDKEEKVVMLNPRRARLEYKNIEPNFDIAMVWPVAFGNFYLNGKRIEGPPLSDERMEYIKGSGSDPMIELSYIEGLFAPKSLQDDGMNEAVDFTVKGKRVQVEKGVLRINGKVATLKRRAKKDDWERWVYVRDVVKALGGSFRYDSKLDRAYIKL